MAIQESEVMGFMFMGLFPHTVPLPRRPPDLSKTRMTFRVELGLATLIRLSLRKRTTPLGESLLLMVTLATFRDPRTAPSVAPTSTTSNISARSLGETITVLTESNNVFTIF